MLGKIEKILDNIIYVKLGIDIRTVSSLLNMYVIMQDSSSSFIGEIVSIDGYDAKINLLGEYKNNNLTSGFIKKPAFNAKIDLLSPNFVELLIGNKTDDRHSLLIGNSPFYSNVNIYANINNFFGSHFAIFGSTGAGKSCGFARIMQNLINKNNISNNMHLVIFDAYGEYKNAFSNSNFGNFNFKSYSTDNKENANPLIIPPYFLDTDDFALLLEAQKSFQVSIIEKALRNVNLFKKDNNEVIKYKNSIIASAILDILASGKPASQLRDQVFSVLTKFNTPDLNLNSIVSQPGYNRTLKQCFLIDENNKINAMELVNQFLQNFITDNVESSLPDGTIQFSLQDFADGLDFALIHEGVWKSEKTYDEVNILKVRLNSLMNSDNKKFFEYNDYISKEKYINQLFTSNEGKPCQIINFNINSIDDRFAKILVKIYSKLFFNYTKNLEPRASFPIHIILEEAHRYVQHDNDIELIGYNIFERIAKEGRKFGILLGLISQRPSELSEVCLSQCNNFLLFKLTHPYDLEFISKIIPNISEEILNKMKTIQPGYCLTFGSAFKITSVVKLDMPTPAPDSDNCNISELWFV